MSWPDIVNGSLELAGGAFIAASIWRLHREKQVRGVSMLPVLFFAAWGVWNLFFYPHLGQLVSTIGAVGTLLANAVWLAQIVYYRRAERIVRRYTR